MAHVVMSPTMSTKLKSRAAANKIKHGSPKLQQVLRERCRQKMREKRGQLFNRSRSGLQINSENVQDTLTEIVRREISNLEPADWADSTDPAFFLDDEPLTAEEALDLENEIISEQEQWILEEYEKMSREEIEMLALRADQQVEEVVCPICQKSSLTEEMNRLTCKVCSFVLNTSITANELGCLIRESANVHSSSCTEPPGFTLLPENNNICLYMMCQKCSTLAPIM